MTIAGNKYFLYLQYTKDCPNGGGAKEHDVHVGDVVRLSYDPGRQTLVKVCLFNFVDLISSEYIL